MSSTEDTMFDPIDRGPAKEVPGDFDGYVIFEGPTPRGRVEMDLDDGKMILHWTSETAAWPGSFSIEPPPSTGAPSTSHSVTFEHGTFSGTAQSEDVSGCQYAIKAGGVVIGWMHHDAEGSTWYAVPSKVTTEGLYDATSLEFVPNTETGSVSALKVYDSVL